VGQVVPPEQIGKIENERLFRLRVFNLFREFNGFIDLGVSTQTNAHPGQTSYSGNVNGQWVNVTAPVAANTEFALAHSLVDGQGTPKIPSFYFFIADRSCNLYQLPNTGTAWTTTQVFLKCDTSSAILRVFLL
jgi:hypothetical protein